MYYLAVDAGGTKAAYAICDANGRVQALCECSGLTPPDMERPQIIDALENGIARASQQAGISRDEIAAAVIGMPCFGESDAGDKKIIASCEQAFIGIEHSVVNDAEVAWAGSFAMQPGINIVCGTGTIAFGRDKFGNAARCGGWSYHFSDEGSGYWLGKRLLHLFCKQADGRLPRSHVYDIVRERMGLNNDFEVIDIAERDYIPVRAQVASLQRWLLDAAKLGDSSALEAYRDAASEIAMCIKGIGAKLQFDGSLKISYSGGIFNVGAPLMAPLKSILPAPDYEWMTPLAPPWAGGLMMAMSLIHNDTTEAKDNLIEEAKSCRM